MPGRASDAAADWLGIDFGTCYSSAARIVDGQPVAVKEPVGRGYSVPSSVMLTSANGREELVVGVAAERQRLGQPHRFTSEFKRVLGQREQVELGGRQFPVGDLVAEVVGYLRREAEKAGARELPNAVVTVPVSYEQHLRDLMVEAARKAGFARVELLEEPVAALIDYAHDADGTAAANGLVLVYDLGGGTFDCALVNVDGGGHEVLGYDGIEDVGGANFDRAVEGDVARQAGDILARSLEARTSDVETERIAALRDEQIAREKCRELKHDLSSLETARTDIFLSGGLVEYELTRERLAEMIDVHIRRTLECCKRVLEEAGRAWGDVAGILMVGGSCRLPFVEQAVASESGRPIWHVDDPELTVCEGAALHAAALAIPAVRDLVVDAGGAGDHTSIGAAVDAAAPGAKVVVKPGRYEESVTLDKEVELVGDGFRTKIELLGKTGPALTVTARDGARVHGISLGTRKKIVISIAEGASATIESCDIVVRQGEGVTVAGGAVCVLRGNHIFDPAADAPDAAEGTTEPERLKTIGVRARDGSNVTLEHNDLKGLFSAGVQASGEDTVLVCRGDRFEQMGASAVVVAGADATLERCDIARTTSSAVVARGDGTELTMQGSRIKDVDEGAGVLLTKAAAGRIEQCEISDADSAVHVDAALADIQGCTLRANGVGVNAARGASARLDDNDVVESHQTGVSGQDKGTTLELVRNRIIEGDVGVAVAKSAALVVADTTIRANSDCGVAVGERSSADIRECRIEAAGSVGIRFGSGATGTIEGNDVLKNGMSGIVLCDSATAPTVRGNEIHRNLQAGLLARNGAGGVVEENRIYNNKFNGIEVRDAHTTTVVRRNAVRDNHENGILVNGAAGDLTGNRIENNQGRGIQLSGPQPGSPKGRIEANKIHGNAGGALGGALAWTGLGRNDLGLTGKGAPLQTVADYMEAGRFDAADTACIELIFQRSGRTKIDSMEKAAKVPVELLRQMNALWLEATGGSLRSRRWVVTDSDITTTAFINTYLEKKLKQLGM